jgi:hypothetical protein
MVGQRELVLAGHDTGEPGGICRVIAGLAAVGVDEDVDVGKEVVGVECRPEGVTVGDVDQEPALGVAVRRKRVNLRGSLVVRQNGPQALLDEAGERPAFRTGTLLSRLRQGIRQVDGRSHTYEHAEPCAGAHQPSRRQVVSSVAAEIVNQ